MTSSNSRRRAVVEMLVCAVLVATLAVQPALGDKGRGKGKGGDDTPAAANAQGTVTPPASHSGPGPHGAASAPPAATGPRGSRSGSSPGNRRGSESGSAAGGHRDSGSESAAITATSGGDRGGSGRGRGRGRGDRAPAAAAPVPPPPPAPVEVDERDDDDAREDRRGRNRGRNGSDRPQADNAIAPTSTTSGLDRNVTPEAARPTTPPANATAPETVVATPAAVAAPPPPAPGAGAPPLAPPAAGAPAATPAPDSATGGPAASGRRPRSAPGGGVPASGTVADLPGTAGAPAGAAAPATPLSAPLATPATAAIELAAAREAGPASTSRPRSGEAEGVPALGSPQPRPITRVVENVIEVIPTLVWIALAALGALVLALGAHSVFATARTRRLERQRERLMEDVGLLQAALLPAVPSRMGALLTTVAYRPADGPAGGDFYDAFPLSDGRVGLLLGDVSGHGRQALAKTTLVRFSVRAHLEAGMSPREAIAIAGRSLDGRLADDFATVLAAIHDPATGTLTYSSAGHPPPIVLGPPAHAPVTASSAPPIGVGFPTGQRQTVLPMPEGTTVAVLSDGLLEARIDGVPLGAERLTAWLAELGPEATARQLLDLVVERADSVPDDLAAVVLHAAPGATAPAARIEQLKLDVLDVEGPDLDGFLEGAGVDRAERAAAGRRVSEQLAVTGGVIVEVMTGEHPRVIVVPIGDRAGAAAAQGAPAR
jgi:hypothetical protein